MASPLAIEVPAVLADQAEYLRHLHADQFGSGLRHYLRARLLTPGPFLSQRPTVGRPARDPERWILPQERCSRPSSLYIKHFRSSTSAPGRIRTRGPLLRGYLRSAAGRRLASLYELSSAASGYVCPVDDAAEPFVVGVVVAPDDVPADHAALLFVAGVVGAVQREVPQCGELRLYAV
jgi:hypothetical protein